MMLFKRLLNPAFLLASVLLFLSFISLSVNYLYFGYLGVNYFPPEMVAIFLLLILMASGIQIFFELDKSQYRYTQALWQLFLVFSVIAVATNAAQYTPFAVIDPYIIALEKALGIDLAHMMTWANLSPWIRASFDFIYSTLTAEIILIPLLLIGLHKYKALEEFFFLLLFTTLIGFCFYYFFPTLAPAAFINSPYFSVAQHDTSLKFYQIHHYIAPTTMEGGLISMPSFHVIWAWLCLYMSRSLKWLFWLLLPLNSLIIISCVLLGWHYLLDVFASLILVGFAHYTYDLLYPKRAIEPQQESLLDKTTPL